MMQTTKEYIDLNEKIEVAIRSCSDYDDGRIFSYTFRYESKDLLPLLTHPADKNICRIY